MNEAKVSQSMQQSRVPRGVLNPNGVRKALFALSALCVLACVVMSILAIWDYVGNQAAFKMLASSGVLFAGGLLFELLNHKFGAALELSAPVAAGSR